MGRKSRTTTTTAVVPVPTKPAKVAKKSKASATPVAITVTKKVALAGPVGLDLAHAFANPAVEREAKLMCADVAGNNNKFYTLQLQKSSDGWWRVLINYGRVGANGRWEVRSHTSDRWEAESTYDELYQEKTTRRKEPYREVQIVGAKTAAVVAVTGAGGAIQARDAVRAGARAPLAWPASAQKFYNALLHEATCLVETGMQASSVSDQGLVTPLGLVGEADIRAALKILEEIAEEIADPTLDPANASDELLADLNSKFFKYIPTKISGGTKAKLRDNMIVTAAQVADKQQLLDSALGLIAASTQPVAGGTYPVTLEEVDATEGAMLNALLRKERCRCHDNQSLSWRTAFRVVRPSDVSKFREDLCGGKDPLMLFHGTRRTTGAGILSRGFLPTRAATASGGSYSGSAYGDGIYFASNAGKSLGYTGATTGQRLLFVSFVAMGNVHVHNGRATGWNSFTRRAGCDSVHAIGGNDLAHDEMIVPRPEQTCIAYVLEV